jgi:hypothetical protein
MNDFNLVSAKVLPWVKAAKPLEEPFSAEPEFQAAYALWEIILRPGRNVNARLSALREYYDRTRGRPGQGDDDDGTEELDLSLLSPEEVEQLLYLMQKARGGQSTEEE